MKEDIKNKVRLKKRRVVRTRAKVFGTAEKPRLAVYRSLKHISIQVINDEEGKTLASVSDKEVVGKNRQEKAREIGKLMAKKLSEQKIVKVIFDKRHYKYHGLIKEVAEGVREGGINF